jgi:hypothetical protein
MTTKRIAWLIVVIVSLLSACGNAAVEDTEDDTGSFCLTFELRCSARWPVTLVTVEEFGPTPLGEARVMTVTIHNYGDGRLRIDEIEFSESDDDGFREFEPRGWRPSDVPIDVDWYGERKLWVVYRPLNRIRDELEIVFHGNDPHLSPHRVRVRPRVVN